MPNFKHNQFFHQNNDGAFDVVHLPPAAAPYSGIYRCEGCGEEISSTQHHPLPPQNHHQHRTPTQGKVRWRLVAAAIHVS